MFIENGRSNELEINHYYDPRLVSICLFYRFLAIIWPSCIAFAIFRVWRQSPIW